MRLSEIRGERVLDVISDCIGPAVNIASDESAMALFRPQKPKKGQTPSEAMAERAKKGVPSLLRTHGSDVVQILASLDGKTVEEYESAMTLASVLEDVFELLTDEEFATFLSSQEPDGEPSGSL